jgi:hypothetical protein
MAVSGLGAKVEAASLPKARRTHPGWTPKRWDRAPSERAVYAAA